MADRFTGPLADAPYFGRYERMASPWRMVVGEVDGEPAVVVLRPSGREWTTYGIVRVDIVDHRITRVVDYSHCPWVLPATNGVVVEPVSSIAPEA